jgi:hypothetical protein
MLSQKLLKDVGVDTFAGENRCLAEKYRCFPVLFPGDGRTFKFGDYGGQSAKNQNSANGR